MNRKFLCVIFLMTLANGLSANDECSEIIDLEEVKALHQDIGNAIAENTLGWWSATDEQITKAQCPGKVPSSDQITNYLKGHSVDTKKSHIQGHEVEDESSDLINAMTDLLYRNDWSGEHKGNYAGMVPANCKKVKCMAENIFGKELGPKLLYLKLAYGLNSSEYANPNSSRLTIEEVDIFIKAASSLPTFLLPLDTNKQMTKYKRGFSPADTPKSILANATITFFDGWNRQTPVLKEYLAFHELSHYIDGELNLSESPEWLEFSGWEKKGDKWQRIKKDVFASKYGYSNPHEDMSESMTAYRYNPSSLKEANIDKYNFLKEVVFQGVEYTDSQKCKDKNGYISKLITEVNQSQNNFTDTLNTEQSNFALEQSYKGCEKEIIDIMTGKEDNSFRNCLAKEMPYVIENHQKKKTIKDEILKSVKYKTFVNNSMELTDRNIPRNVKREDLDKLNSKNYLSLKLSIEKESITALKKVIMGENYRLKYIAKEEICDEIAEYSDQSYQFIGEKSQNELASYNNKEKFISFTKDACRLLIENGAIEDNNFSEDEIHLAYIEIKAKNDPYFNNLSRMMRAISKNLKKSNGEEMIQKSSYNEMLRNFK